MRRVHIGGFCLPVNCSFTTHFSVFVKSPLLGKHFNVNNPFCKESVFLQPVRVRRTCLSLIIRVPTGCKVLQLQNHSSLSLHHSVNLVFVVDTVGRNMEEYDFLLTFFHSVVVCVYVFVAYERHR